MGGRGWKGDDARILRYKRGGRREARQNERWVNKGTERSHTNWKTSKQRGRLEVKHTHTHTWKGKAGTINESQTSTDKDRQGGREFRAWQGSNQLLDQSADQFVYMIGPSPSQQSVHTPLHVSDSTHWIRVYFYFSSTFTHKQRWKSARTV